VAGFDAVRAAVNYENAASAAIKALKYEGQTRLAVPLGELVLRAIDPEQWPVEIVTAVPLHSARLRERGYNQAALLAETIAQQRGWWFCPAALERGRETQSQVHLNAVERQQNVAGAFSADSRLVYGKTVLLVDDVLTTGATLSACAAALRQAGAAHIYGATAAAALFTNQS
jgi:ComF family protein